ncbi:ABC transporter permease [Rhizobium sp. LjRoot254]|uniref:ABC transporter permease n=1 Tax=Rhizobium sp. LjRoot254 TaxID=3342297 RepID=UPI003ECEB129
MSGLKLDAGLHGRIAIALILAVGLSIAVPGFASIATAASVFENVGLIALIGTGIMLTMVVGQLDLSIASVAAVAAIIALKIAGVSLLLGILVALGVATVYGAAIGYVIGRTGINSMVLTVCTLIGLRGLALVMAPQRPAILPGGLFWLSDALVIRMGPVTVLGLIGIGVVAIIGVLMRCTTTGLSMYAVGGHAERARGSGVDTTRVYMVAFAGSAVLGALAGILAAVRSGSASGLGFESFLLAGITAAVVGGVPLEGGRGTVINVLIGAFIIRLVSTAVSLGGIAGSFESIVIGSILLAMLLLDYWLRKRGGSRSGSRRTFNQTAF